MKILTAKQIKTAEERAFAGEFTEEGLMKAAGDACFKKIVSRFKKKLAAGKTAVFCGNGKNAGDGFVIAKMLKINGYDAEIVLADKEPFLPEPCIYFNDAKENGVAVRSFSDLADNNYPIIVDCLFGIGFHGEAKPPFDRAIDFINGSNAFVISIDTPSGTDATEATAFNAVRADFTIAISTLKYCHILPPASEYSKVIEVVDIGIPEKYFDDGCPCTITDSSVKDSFLPREKNSHKGTFGRQLNICGSYQMPGAAVICAEGALKTGVGLLKCVFPKSIYPVMTAHLIQPVFKPLCENEAKTVSIGAVNDILAELNWADSIALGCGLGNNDDVQVIVSQVLKNSRVPVVLDADGLNAAASFIDIIKDRTAPLVITPHPAEMARLIDDEVENVQSNRIGVAKSFAAENDCIVVLKGANTVVTDGKTVYVNTTGNSGMAMGGTGDMLTGMIASFIAQGLSPYSAAGAAVYIHGLCGDITARELSRRGMTVENMLELLGALMSEFE